MLHASDACESRPLRRERGTKKFFAACAWFHANPPYIRHRRCCKSHVLMPHGVAPARQQWVCTFDRCNAPPRLHFYIIWINNFLASRLMITTIYSPSSPFGMMPHYAVCLSVAGFCDAGCYWEAGQRGHFACSMPVPLDSAGISEFSYYLVSRIVLTSYYVTHILLCSKYATWLKFVGRLEMHALTQNVLIMQYR